ncbi:hypothetical protein IW261DRAFT_1426648 [Armillaria novae-zelandiae]|uniref:Uncharacterized protein n=1 Tax=Armillaria novae-zelandiae TaxID=153914 RepID=A0AA39NKX9_9AGAR|nr:hypothetical protein IW261DRAFT_1426648 [Armillaria novae-zelandiae]
MGDAVRIGNGGAAVAREMDGATFPRSGRRCSAGREKEIRALRKEMERKGFTEMVGDGKHEDLLLGVMIPAMDDEVAWLEVLALFRERGQRVDEKMQGKKTMLVRMTNAEKHTSRGLEGVAIHDALTMQRMDLNNIQAMSARAFILVWISILCTPFDVSLKGCSTGREQIQLQPVDGVSTGRRMKIRVIISIRFFTGNEPLVSLYEGLPAETRTDYVLSDNSSLTNQFPDAVSHAFLFAILSADITTVQDNLGWASYSSAQPMPRKSSVGQRIRSDMCHSKSFDTGGFGVRFLWSGKEENFDYSSRPFHRSLTSEASIVVLTIRYHTDVDLFTRLAH